MFTAACPVLDSAVAKKVATYQCNDGVDNDGDGLTDYGGDPTCWAPFFDTEAPECSDGIDNDNSGAADYPADVDACHSPDTPVERDVFLSACDDGWDNDLDGKIDSADSGCGFPGDQTETREKK